MDTGIATGIAVYAHTDPTFRNDVALLDALAAPPLFPMVGYAYSTSVLQRPYPPPCMLVILCAAEPNSS